MRARILLLGAMILLLFGLGRLQTGPAQATITGETAVFSETAVHIPLILKNYPPPTEPYLLTQIQLPGGSHPHGIALDVAGRRAFVGNHHANTLSVLDTTTNAIVAAIPLPGADGPNGVAYHAGTDRVYVANRNSGNVSVVDPTAGQWLQNITVGALPNGVAVQGDRIYVANWGSDSVTVIDANTNTATHTFAVGAQPALMADNDTRGFVYLAAYGGNMVQYLRDGGIFNNRTGIATPYGVAFDPVWFRLYAANRGSEQEVTLVDVNPNRLTGAIPTGGEVFTVGVNPRTGHVFAVMGDRVQVYDRRDKALLATIAVGAGAEEGIAVDAANGRIYVTSGAADEVAVIQDTAVYDIAYATWVKNVGHLYVMDDSGAHQGLVAGPDEAFMTPDWHPDGNQLVFARRYYGRGEFDIWTAEPGGTNVVNLTSADSGSLDEYPRYSPDGAQIAWVRNDRIWLMDADGGNQAALTPDGLMAEQPHWSPDGSWIVFAGREIEAISSDIYRIPTAGGTPENLTNGAGDNNNPDVSPDGAWIAFNSNRDGGSDIYLVKTADPAQQVRLTSTPGSDTSPSWSPDGSQIAYISYEGGCGSPCVFVMDADGGNQRNLTGGTNVLTPLQWSPDGRWLATHTLGGAVGSQIVKINVDSGEIIQITDGGESHMWPVWRPDTWQ